MYTNLSIVQNIMQINTGNLKRNYNTDLNSSNILQAIKSFTKCLSFNVQQCCLNDAIRPKGLRVKAFSFFFFLFVFPFKAVFLLRSPNSAELESASPGPHHARVQQRCTTAGILYINIHSFQSVLMEKYTFSDRLQIQNIQMCRRDQVTL